ncbi:uncharacterized protein L199_004173 [Kwoniella botswanensis]|uniref:uncharacterized protein n=1 Tax=Kwoniella botswanensis TaxID=1268659 RepID=UPI00315DA4F2
MADTDDNSKSNSQHLQVPATQGNDRSLSPSGASQTSCSGSGSGGTLPTNPTSGNNSSTRLPPPSRAQPRNLNVGYNVIMHQRERDMRQGTTPAETSIFNDLVSAFVVGCCGCCDGNCIHRLRVPWRSSSGSGDQSKATGTSITLTPSVDSGSNVVDRSADQPKPHSPRMEYGNSSDGH